MNQSLLPDNICFYAARAFDPQCSLCTEPSAVVKALLMQPGRALRSPNLLFPRSALGYVRAPQEHQHPPQEQRHPKSGAHMHTHLSIETSQQSKGWLHLAYPAQLQAVSLTPSSASQLLPLVPAQPCEAWGYYQYPGGTDR